MSDYSDGRLNVGLMGCSSTPTTSPFIHWERSGLPTTRSEG